MRTITEFTERPKEKEVIIIDDRASVFIRENITSEETEEGTRYSAVEYSAQVNAKNFELTDEFVSMLILAETDKAAQEIRAKRDKLLAESDKEVMPDRTSNYEAWAEYRQALRDISEQEGFPFDTVFPEKPTNEGAPLANRISDLEDAVVELAEIITEG